MKAEQSNTEQKISTLTQRIELLNRKLWRYKLLHICSLGVCALAVLSAASTENDIAQEIRARRFAVVDAEGKARAVLQMIGIGTEVTPGLTLFDGQGNRRVQLSLPDGGPALEFYRKDNSRLLSIWTLAESLPNITLYDKNQKPRIQLDLLPDQIWPDSSPRITLADADQHVRLRLGAGTEGRSQVEIIDSRGEPVWKAPSINQ